MMLRYCFLILMVFNLSFITANESIKELINKGELKVAIKACDEILKHTDKKSRYYEIADSLKQIAQRIYIDFSKNETITDSILNKRIGAFTPEQKTSWENNKWLEYRILDGKKLYFKNAVGNLILRLNQIRDSINAGTGKLDDFAQFKINYVNDLFSDGYENGKPSQPKNFSIKYTVSLKPNQVPEGETIRCWLPWPKETHLRQGNIKLLNTFPADYKISKANSEQRSIYFEQKTQKNKPTVFKLEFDYTSSAQYFDISKFQIQPYKTNSKLFQKNTAEQLPHIIFTDKIKHLADSLTQNETNPYQIVKNLYYYISNNYIWSSALEYSIIPNIPQYVIEHRRGDCGMKTLLFMTLARYKGIPVKWQSGWMMHPNELNLHDWCEVYYENIGWVPLDMSFGLLDTDNEKIKEFYITGIDAFRMIVNDNISSPLSPKKTFLRSEPYDFQRGELEWKGGNLYFNQWNYDMEVVYK